MSQLIAMFIALIGVALSTAGPGCAMCTESEECSMCTAKEAVEETKPESCCNGGACGSSEASPYESANWPAHNKEISSKDFQGQSLPVNLGTETWISKEIKTEDKVIVLDFWATWCPPCRKASPILDKLQKANPNTLAVIAIAGQRDEESKVRDYVKDHPVAYAHLYDEDQTVFKPLKSKSIPLVIVLSTDGIIRWIGNPHEKAFIAAVNQTIAADPQVQANLTAQANAEG